MEPTPLGWEPKPRKYNPDLSSIARQAAAKVSPQVREARSRAGGTAVLRMYGASYFAYISGSRRVRVS